jgi:hypothetical protein
MRTLGWGGIAALTLLAGAATADAQPPRDKAMPDGWWAALWGESKPKDDPKSAAPKGPTMEEKAREMDRLLKAFQRREAVCEKLTAIAQDTGDDRLFAEASRLYEDACKLYQRQSNVLGIATVGHTNRDAEADEPYELPRPAREPNVGIVPSRMRSSGGGLGAGISEPSSRSLEGQR